MEQLRVVLDTNVIVSALAFPGGPPSALFELALQQKIAGITSDPLLDELDRILRQKIGWPEARVQRVRRQVVRRLEVVVITESVSDFTVDPADNRVLEAALAGRANLIATGDRALRALDAWRGVQLCTIREALELLTEPTE